jgi:RNA polymerase sigma-70 factor (ECF subfamily)
VPTLTDTKSRRAWFTTTGKPPAWGILPVNRPGRLVVIPGVEAQRGSGRGEPDPPRQDADAAFLRALYAEHGAALLGYATRLTGDRGRAEDLVQETLLRAWRHAEKLATDPRPLRPWLFTVLSRLATDAHRAGAARPVEVPTAEITAISGPEEPERALWSWQVAEALRSLSGQHRAVLIAIYYRGHSLAETATRLGVPGGTVKSRCYYALRALRLALAEQYGGPG